MIRLIQYISFIKSSDPVCAELSGELPSRGQRLHHINLLHPACFQVEEGQQPDRPSTRHEHFLAILRVDLGNAFGRITSKNREKG